MNVEGVTIRDAAKKYGVSVHTVRRWWQTGRIKGKTVLGHVLLDEKALAKYYKANKVDITKFVKAHGRGGRIG